MQTFIDLRSGVSLQLLASVLFIGLCCQGHAEDCQYQNPPGSGGIITSITPSTWYAGQTIQITITGNFPGGDQPGCEMNEGDQVGQGINLDLGGDPYLVNNYPGITIETDENGFAVGTFTPTQVTLTVQVAWNAPSGPAYVSLSCDGCHPYTTMGGPVQIVGWAKNIGDCCNNLSGSDGAGDPINVNSGNVFEQVTDYQTAGQNKLSFIRYYNSLSVAGTYALDLGTNWRSNYDRYLQLISTSLITAERPDGQQINFYNSGSGWTSDSDVDYTLTQTGSTWTLTDHNDTTEVYDGTTGFLQSITLRNGYAQTMTYNPNYQLTTVTDSYSRQLTFTYTNGGTVSTVTTPDDLVLTYGYNSINYADDQLASVSYSTSPVTSQHCLYQNANLPYAMTSIQDENGATYESWTYDNLGRGLTSQMGGIANLTTFTYNDTDNSRTVTNALGVTDTYTLTYLQNDYKISNVSRAATSTTAAATETFSYDSNGYLSGMTDWNGNQTTYVNDSHGDPTTINEAVGSSVARTTTIAYDPTWVQLPDTITTPGLTTTFAYDGSGEVLTRTLTDTTTQSTPYSTNGSTREWQYTWQNALLATVQSPRTDVVEKTTYTYDSIGALTAIANPLNQQTTITSHTGGGLALTIVDSNNVTTNLTYDPRQRLLTSTVITSGGNRTTTYGYDAAENLTSVTQPDNSKLTYTYDAAHRLTDITDLFGQKISYTLDALGDRTATKVRNASSTVTSQHSNAFDALGRMLQDTGAASQTSSFTYDAMGNMVTATDQATNLTQRAFDALNRLYQITDPASGITTTSYDAHDRPLSATSPTGVVTAYVYDGFGDVIQESNPNTGTAVYYYDSTGNRTKGVAATGAVTQYTYDALDRVLTMTFLSDSAENVSYTYDESGHGSGIGRLTSVSDAAGTLSRSYDQLGNLLTDARMTSAAMLTTWYTYDPANRIASISYPSGTLVSYTRDTMGRITSVSAQPSGGSSTPVASSIAYEPFGPDTGFRYGSAGQETRGFDQDYRLTNVTSLGTVRRGLVHVFENLSYGYYPTNNVHTITDALNSGNSQSFSYDNLLRLSQAAGSYGSFGFTYDGDGNQLTQTLGATTTNYGYGSASDQLATISVGGVQTQAIGYTADGRMASLNPGIQTPGSQYITSLSYNQDAQLSAVNAGSGALASYTYDGFGQRLIKTVSPTYGEIYQYGQDGMLLEETNSSGLAQADYIYLNGRPVAVLNGSTLYFLHDDRLGTPQVASDNSQNIQWQASYDSFGQASVSGTITQNLRFPGQYFDVESGWNHNGFRDYVPNLGRYIQPDPLGMQGSARYYNPSTGRFLSEDLLGILGGINLYAYADDSPTNFSDPTGWATYITNRLIAGSTAVPGWEGVSHTFVFSTNPDGSIAATYSWGNTANPVGWNLDQAEDMKAAAQALANGDAQMVGGDYMDPFYRQAFDQLNNPANNHGNGWVHNNCKTEANNLRQRATQLWNASPLGRALAQMQALAQYYANAGIGPNTLMGMH